MQIYQNTLNNFLNLVDENERIQIILDGIEFYFKGLDETKLKTKHLSEGYRDHILLISDILLRIIACRNNLFEHNICRTFL